jgi:hypothetical protein
MTLSSRPSIGSPVTTIRLVLQMFNSILSRSWCGPVLAVAVLSFGIAACAWMPRAPSRVIPTTAPELTIDIIEIPDTVCVGDTAIFVIRTTPGNECLGDIGYWNSKGSWVGPSFDPVVADMEGNCRWTWTVTDDAVPGTAEFRVGVRGHDTISSRVPQVFQVQVCAQ